MLQYLHRTGKGATMVFHCFEEWRRHISHLFLSLLFFSLVTFEARQWLLPREANFSHMFLTFIPSNGPICLSKCVCCVLFPARFVPMPSLQWAPLSPGVWAEASRYLYRPNSWGPPSQSSAGWLEKLSWKLQVKPSVGNVSLFPLFYSLVLLSVICLHPMGVQSGQVRLCSAQVNWTARQTSLTCLSSHLQSHIYLSVLFSFYIHTATNVFFCIFPLWNTLSSPASN